MIQSDHVVEVVSAGVDEATGIAWLAMELLKGETLGQAITARGAMRWDDVGQVFEQLGHALGAAHRLGLVHRDLKPDNLFLETPRRSGVPFTLKVLDFGIAKYADDPSVRGQTTAAIGSPMWMAPEQASPGPVTPATDVWALGLIAFYVFTGKSYWRSVHGPTPTMTALISEILVSPLDPATVRARALGALAPLPAGFDAWFARCDDRDPARRFQQADEATRWLLDVLRGFAFAETAAVPPRRRIWPYVVLAMAIGGFGLAAVAVVARHRIARAERDAGLTAHADVASSSPSTAMSEVPVIAELAPSSAPSTSLPVVRAPLPSATHKVEIPTPVSTSVTPSASSTVTGVDPAYAAYAQGQVMPLIQQCWTAAQKETANHPTEHLRLTMRFSEITGRAYQVDAPGLSDHRLQWCIQVEIGRVQFRRPSVGVDVTLVLTLTPD